MTLSRKSFHENCILKAPGLAQCLKCLILKAEFSLTLSLEVVVTHSHSLGMFADLCCYFLSLCRASVNYLLSVAVQALLVKKIVMKLACYGVQRVANVH